MKMQRDVGSLPIIPGPVKRMEMPKKKLKTQLSQDPPFHFQFRYKRTESEECALPYCAKKREQENYAVLESIQTASRRWGLGNVSQKNKDVVAESSGTMSSKCQGEQKSERSLPRQTTIRQSRAPETF